MSSWVRDLRDRAATRLRALNKAPNRAAEGSDSGEISDAVRTVIKEVVSSEMLDKDNVVRDIKYEVLDELIKISKFYATIIAVPVGIITLFFAVEGVRDLRSFFERIEPQIKAAQSAINDDQKRLQAQQTTIGRNESRTAVLRMTLDNQQSSVEISKSNSCLEA